MPKLKAAVIVGPTAGGKTRLAVECALAYRERYGSFAEIISADSMLVYRGLDIGTAKPTAAERRGVVHHLIDICDPDEPFSVRDWLTSAEEAMADIRARGGWPLIVGGTHLYIKSLLEGMFDGPGADEVIRERLHALPTLELRQLLETLDPATAARLHTNDIRRTVRALEVLELTGTRISEHRQQWDKGGDARDDLVLCGLDWPVELLNPRINARVRLMVESGLVAEVIALREQGKLSGQSEQALGYKQILAHLDGHSTLNEAIEQIKIETRRFAKNQRTWAKRLRTTPGAVWLSVQDASEQELQQNIATILASCIALADNATQL